jgi:uncharacterized membrane protein
MKKRYFKILFIFLTPISGSLVLLSFGQKNDLIAELSYLSGLGLFLISIIFGLIYKFKK